MTDRMLSEQPTECVGMRTARRCRGNDHDGSWKMWSDPAPRPPDQSGKTSDARGSDAPLRKAAARTGCRGNTPQAASVSAARDRSRGGRCCCRKGPDADGCRIDRRSGVCRAVSISVPLNPKLGCMTNCQRGWAFPRSPEDIEAAGFFGPQFKLSSLSPHVATGLSIRRSSGFNSVPSVRGGSGKQRRVRIGLTEPQRCLTLSQLPIEALGRSLWKAAPGPRRLPRRWLRARCR